jgi:hypothetical protein
MTEYGAGPACEDSGHPSAPSIDCAAPHGVDAMVDEVQGSAFESTADCAGAEPHVEQLPAGHYAVLPFG